MISISIVSHGQLSLVQRLLTSLETIESDLSAEILVTENLGPSAVSRDLVCSLPLRLLVNRETRGLARNLNESFRHAKGEYFCILNPDIIFGEELLRSLKDDIESGAGDIVAPLVVDTSGNLQDSSRELPSPWTLIKRRAFGLSQSPGGPESISAHPDWIAGMFMLLRASTYRELGGMQEAYRLYFEDVDFCTRARLAGYQLSVNQRVKVVHDAQRGSRRHPKYLAWHVVSALRFLSSPVYRRARQ